MTAVRRIARPAVTTITAYSTGELPDLPRAPRRAGRRAALTVTQVPTQVMEVARRVRLPGQRIRVINGTTVLVENITN